MKNCVDVVDQEGWVIGDVENHLKCKASCRDIYTRAPPQKDPFNRYRDPSRIALCLSIIT